MTKISKLLTEERHNYLPAFEEDKDRMPNQLHRQFLFTRLKKYVTSYVMLKILPQVKKLKKKQKKGKDLDPCTGAFTKVWGLSFAHIIERRCLEDVAIPLSDVDQHWQFYKPRPTRSDSPDVQWEDWPKDRPQRRHFHYVSHERTQSLEPIPLPEEVENQRLANIDRTGTTPRLK